MTLGCFIAYLRKTNGMTQREMAEILNVSDKTISRWERDEGSPDISQLPILADLFGITIDDLLRCRKEEEERKEREVKEEVKAISLPKTLLNFKNSLFISAGISIIGFILSVITNFVFLRAKLGFLIGSVFFVASAILEILFMNTTLFRIEESGDESSSLYKRKTIDYTISVLGLIIILIGYTFPLLFQDPFYGLDAKSFLTLGLLSSLLFLLLLYSIVIFFLYWRLVKKGVVTMTEAEYSVYAYNHSLKSKLALLLIAIILITAIPHYFSTIIWGPGSIMEGTVFTDYQSFISFMEEERPSASGETSLISEESLEAQYYDREGNEITKEEALTRRLEDSEGKVVCQYISLNSDVISLRYTPKKGDILPLTVFTKDNLKTAQEKAYVRHMIFMSLYAMECILIVLTYYIKRRK